MGFHIIDVPSFPLTGPPPVFIILSFLVAGMFSFIMLIKPTNGGNRYFLDSGKGTYLPLWLMGIWSTTFLFVIFRAALFACHNSPSVQSGAHNIVWVAVFEWLIIGLITLIGLLLAVMAVLAPRYHRTIGGGDGSR